MELGKRSNWSSSIFEETINKLQYAVTFEQLAMIVEQSREKMEILKCAMKKYEGDFTLGQVLELTDKCGWYFKCLSLGLNRMKGFSQTEDIKIHHDLLEEMSNEKSGLYFWTSLLHAHSSLPVSLARVMR